MEYQFEQAEIRGWQLEEEKAVIRAEAKRIAEAQAENERMSRKQYFREWYGEDC